jgi:hypothetical protein
VQHPLGLQAGGQTCCVHCCLLFFSFFGLLLFAKAPVAKEHTIASMIIFFILFFLNYRMCVIMERS